MEIMHISAECYPVAKAGGLGDVVGALPKYQAKAGHYAKVAMPMHRTKFLFENNWNVEHKGSFKMADRFLEYTIIKETTNLLGFDLYLVEVPGLTDREKVYGYADDVERFLAFQIAVVDWMNQWQHRPDVVHCHDHHSGLVPFMMQHCYAYNRLRYVKTILTIHNAQYQGWIGWDKQGLLPAWDSWKGGLLEWNNSINSLACAIKCANKVTTVSSSYLRELRSNSRGLESLFEYEKGKCIGILNGIDSDVWNPFTDPHVLHHYDYKTNETGKRLNKTALCNRFGLDESVPLVVFIGRFVREKAADLLPEAIYNMLNSMQGKVAFLVVGTGDPSVESQLSSLNNVALRYYRSEIAFNENLAHLMYAAADFLLMPSRVEPCGLNQMYALRYGTIPIVRRTGGLQDTVLDMGDWQGFGICFNQASVGDIMYSVGRALDVYEDKTHFQWMRNYAMNINHSWDNTVQQYINVYKSL